MTLKTSYTLFCKIINSVVCLATFVTGMPEIGIRITQFILFLIH